MSGPLVAAVDVGGTTIKGGLVTRDGEVLTRRNRSVAGIPQAEIVPWILATLAELVDEAYAVEKPGAVAVGLAVPGLVDERAGVGRSSMILGWREVEFGRLLREFGRPVAFGHDVSSGAYAESRQGAAVGHQDWLFLALGTGLGSTFVLDGRPYRGSLGTGGELAHVVVRPDGPWCRCGKYGCLEMMATGPAIAAAYRTATGISAPVTAVDVARLAAEGDAAAVAVWAEAVAALAEVLAGYVESLNPSLVVVGGGVADAGTLLTPALADAVAERIAFAAPPPVVPAHFGADAALIGIAAAAHEAAVAGLGYVVPFGVTPSR